MEQRRCLTAMGCITNFQAKRRPDYGCSKTSYSRLEVLIENGDVPSNIEPPSATLEADLLRLMSNVGRRS